MLLLIKFFLFPLDKEDKVVVPKDEEAEKESYLRRLFTLRESKDYSKSLTKTLLNLYAERKNPKKSLTTDPKDLDSAIETIKELLEQNNKYIATQEDKCNKEYDRLRWLNMIVDEAFVWLSHNESQLSKNLDRASFNRMMWNNPLDWIK